MKLLQSYLTLGDKFYHKSLPQQFSSPSLLVWNQELATSLNIDSEDIETDEKKAEVFSGNEILQPSTPIALAYSGHQFGHFNPQLGDGRAHLLGEVEANSGQLFDVQLKGSGQTAFSRRGDGKCAIGPAIREYLMSEAMAALRVPTSRCIAVVATGEDVLREGAKPGAVVTRIASSHIRVGTFQYFAARRDSESLIKLVDFSISRHYPEISLDDENKVEKFLASVIQRQITLITEWMRVGFIHGVMNTDNTAISGETIDFGPCAMMDNYEAGKVFSSIDQHGRYAFGNQGRIGQWNMARLADCLLGLVDEDEDIAMAKIEPLIVNYAEDFRNAYYEMMASKLGLIFEEDGEEYISLVDELLSIMESEKLDYSATFITLEESLQESPEEESAHALLSLPLQQWRSSWLEIIDSSKTNLNEVITRMRAQNPSVIPRNHLVEQLIGIYELDPTGDSAKAHLESFLTVLSDPYNIKARLTEFCRSPMHIDETYRTFCGT